MTDELGSAKPRSWTLLVQRVLRFTCFHGRIVFETNWLMVVTDCILNVLFTLSSQNAVYYLLILFCNYLSLLTPELQTRFKTWISQVHYLFKIQTICRVLVSFKVLESPGIFFLKIQVKCWKYLKTGLVVESLEFFLARNTVICGYSYCQYSFSVTNGHLCCLCAAYSNWQTMSAMSSVN